MRRQRARAPRRTVRPSRRRRAAPLRRLRQPDALRRGGEPQDGRVLALLGGGGADRRGGARPRRGRRDGALPLVRLGDAGRGGPGARARRPGTGRPMSERATGSRELGDGLAPPAAPAEAGTPAAPAGEGPTSLPDVPEALLAGYLDAALAALRATPAAELPGALRQYQSWTPRRLRHPRVLGLVRRSLDTDAGFRAAVDRRVLEEEEALARLVRSGRHADALASGEAPEAVARVAVALGREGEAAVHAAVEAAVADQARAQAARAESARAEALEQQLARARAAVQSARAEAAAEQRRLNGRLAELQARLAESQRQYRALR